MMAYCTKFLMLAALLWDTGPETEFLWIFVELLYLVTSVSVLRVTCDLGLVRSWCVMCVTHLARCSSSHMSTVLTNDNVTMTCV